MIRICILDDDSISANIMQQTLNEYLSSHKISFKIDQYECGDDLLRALSAGTAAYQIYFLDILMPGITGIDTAREIRKTDKAAHIVFLTSSAEYALEGYEVRAYDYLQKPLDSDRLFRTLSELLGNMEQSPSKYIQLKCSGILRSVPYDNICYIEAQRNKLLIMQNNGEALEAYTTFSSVADSLKEAMEFTQTHRSYLINMRYIKEFTSTSIKLHSGHQIPVSRNFCQSAKQDYFEFTKSFFY